MNVSSTLNIGRGVTALIGAGGKTTLLYALTEELRRKGRVLLCTSTHIRVPEQYPLVTGGASELRAALDTHGAVCSGTPAKSGKLTAPVTPWDELATLADYVLVEADGARGLPLKAHRPHEPVVPPNAQRVVLVVGADGFGKPVAEACHRPERWAELAGVDVDAPATPEGAARVIAAEGCGDRVLVNKVESAAAYEAAAELAKRLDRPVVAGSLRQGVYVCL